MTVSTTTNKVSYTGTGLPSALAVAFPFFVASDLVVVQRVIATGVEALLALGPDYTVSGGAGSTGTVTVVDVSKFQNTHQWTIRRSIPETQLTDLVNHQALQAETAERDWDRSAMRDQQLREKIERCLHVPVSDPQTEQDLEIPNSVDRASKFLIFDSTGKPTVSEGNVPALLSHQWFGYTSANSANIGPGDAAAPINTEVYNGDPGVVFSLAANELSILVPGWYRFRFDTTLTLSSGANGIFAIHLQLWDGAWFDIPGTIATATFNALDETGSMTTGCIQQIIGTNKRIRVRGTRNFGAGTALFVGQTTRLTVDRVAVV